MYETRMNRRREAKKAAPQREQAGPDIQALAGGAAPTAGQMGSRVDLPGEIREKMESSFGADFSNVKLYESETVAQAGAEAVTQGNNIAFAPGKLDLTSTSGQALLGHELSHVVSQARGESAGRGFLNDPALEAQADRQGMLAARGESAYSGPVSPVGGSSTVSAAGPMQAKKKSKGKYKFDSLSKKYDEFRGAAFSVKIDGKEYKSAEMPLDNLEVDICADGSAGGCRFNISNYYDQSKTKFMDDLVKSIKVGSKLEVKCGYVKQESVFYGYVDECGVEMSDEQLRVTVTGVDGLGFLMNCREPYYGGKKKPKNVVEEIIGKAISAGYAKSFKVGTIPAPEAAVPPVKEQVDDYKYLRLLAKRYCKSLLCINGEILFDNVASSTSPIMTLTMHDGLLSFTRRLSLQNQVGKVVVWGRDVNQKFIKGEANKVSAPGSGKSAVDTASKFSKAVLREFCEYVRTAQECKDLAQARLDSIAMGYVSGEAVCVGMPELIPGRYFEVKSLDGQIDGTYFITKVHHRISTEEGYVTNLEFKGAKA